MSSSETQFAVLLFTDICDSTALKARHGALEYRKVAELHNQLFERIAAEEKLTLIKNTGDGYFARTASVAAAVRFALRFQHGMRTMAWPGFPIVTRVGIHAGEVEDITTLGQADVLAPAADLVARVMGLAVGEQILLTRWPFDEARHFVRMHPPVESGEVPTLTWLAHGPYLFKGCDDPVEVFEVGALALAPLSAPPDGEKAKRAIRPGEEETLGWRPAVGLEVPGRTGWMLARKIGEGGFGEVWLAEQAAMNQRRVFKFCFDEERLRSFKRELTFFRLIRDALGERGDIARLYDVKLDAPPFFLESEFAEHGNLTEWSEQQGGIGAVPMERRLEIVAQVAEAVSAAHSVGILHKDLKPQNVLMQARADGEAVPQITDFGIGALADKSALSAHEITAAGFTVNTLVSKGSGSSMTRLYAPPEQLTGKPYTVQGDVYALGVILYQMVIGDFTRALAPGWERDVKDDLLREDLALCLDGDPARRMASASALAKRIRSLDARHAALFEERRRIAALERRAYRRGIARTASIAAVIIALIVVLTIYGFAQARKARLSAQEEARQRAEAQRQAVAARTATDRANRLRTDSEKLIEFMSLDLKAKLETVGRLDLLEETTLAVETYYEGREEDTSAPGLFRHGLARENRSDVEIARGHLQPAIKAIGEASDYYRRASSTAAGEPGYSLALARSSARLARFLQMKGESDSAVNLAEQCFALIMALPAEFVQAEKHGVMSADTLEKIGRIFASYDHEERGRECFEKAAAWLQAYVKAFPASIQGRVALARTLANSASKSAEPECRARAAEAKGITRLLIEAEPDNRLFLRLRAEIDLAVGPRLNWLGHDVEGLETLDAARKIYEQLHREDPANLELAVALFETHYQIGYLKKLGSGYLRKMDASFDPLPNFKAMNAIADAGVKNSPDDLFWRARLGDCYHRLGEYWGSRKDSAKAIEFETKAVAMHESSMDARSPSLDDLARLAGSYRHLAGARVYLDPNSALEAANKAVELDERSHPGRPGTRASGWIRNTRASVLQRLRRNEEVEADFAKAVDYFAAARPPGFVLQSEKELAAALDWHAKSLADLSRFSEADRRYAERALVLERIVAEGPSEARAEKSLASTSGKRAELALLMKDKAAFREHLKAGVEVFEKALARTPESTSLKDDFAAFIKDATTKALKAGESDLVRELATHLKSQPPDSPPNGPPLK